MFTTTDRSLGVCRATWTTGWMFHLKPFIACKSILSTISFFVNPRLSHLLATSLDCHSFILSILCHHLHLGFSSDVLTQRTSLPKYPPSSPLQSHSPIASPISPSLLNVPAARDPSDPKLSACLTPHPKPAVDTAETLRAHRPCRFACKVPEGISIGKCSSPACASR